MYDSGSPVQSQASQTTSRTLAAVQVPGMTSRIARYKLCLPVAKCCVPAGLGRPGAGQIKLTWGQNQDGPSQSSVRSSESKGQSMSVSEMMQWLDSTLAQAAVSQQPGRQAACLRHVQQFYMLFIYCIDSLDHLVCHALCW